MRIFKRLYPLIIALFCLPVIAQQAPCNATAYWTNASWSPAPPDANTRAVFMENYSSTGDLTVCAVEVLPGARVVFNSSATTGHTLTVNYDVSVAAGAQLRFKNNASLVQINDAVNTGKIIYERATQPVTEYDFTYWSSPVSGQTLHDLSPDTEINKYYEYNAATDNWNVIYDGLANMDAGRGYIIRGIEGQETASVFTAAFSGVPNNGTIATSIAGPGHYNLIGNPYPSAINADCFITDPANAAMNGSLYFWTHNSPITNIGNNNYNYNLSDYAVYNLLGGVGAGAIIDASQQTTTDRPTGMIAAGTGFFVKGLSAGTTTFNNSMRIGGANGQNAQFFRNDAASGASTCSVQRSRLWLQVQKAGTPVLLKQTLVGYAVEATTAATLDRNFDAEVLSTDNSLELYTLSPNNTHLMIQGRALPTDYTAEVINLGVKSAANSSFTISVTEDDGIFDEQVYFLRERISGSGTNAVYAYYDIKNTSHTFTSPTALADDTRFQIVFAKPGPSLKANSCDITLGTIYQTITAVASATIGTQHRFEVTNTQTGAIEHFTSSTTWFKLTQLNSYEYNTTYSIRVAVNDVAGVFGNYGPSCSITTPSLFSGPNALATPQCGTTLPQSFTKILIVGGPYCVDYKVLVTPPVGPPVEITMVPPVINFKLSTLFGPVPPNAVYGIQIKARTTGGYSNYTSPCYVTTPGASALRFASDSADEFEGGVSVYPNPFSSSFAVQMISNSDLPVQLQVYDMLGRQLESKTVSIKSLESEQLGANYPAGVYNVILSQGQTTRSLRVIKR